MEETALPAADRAAKGGPKMSKSLKEGKRPKQADSGQVAAVVANAAPLPATGDFECQRLASEELRRLEPDDGRGSVSL